MGLREKKKARTRKIISDVSRDLFIKHGYAAVTIADIAAEADVAVTTLFNYFPTKESILFDREDELELAIPGAIRACSDRQSVLEVLHEYFTKSTLFNPPNKKVYQDFAELLRSTPELFSYFHGIWDRYSLGLAKSIQKVLKCPKSEAECLAKMMMSGVCSACLAQSPRDSLHMTFHVLKSGWAP